MQVNPFFMKELACALLYYQNMSLKMTVIYIHKSPKLLPLKLLDLNTLFITSWIQI